MTTVQNNTISSNKIFSTRRAIGSTRCVQKELLFFDGSFLFHFQYKLKIAESQYIDIFTKFKCKSVNFAILQFYHTESNCGWRTIFENEFIKGIRTL